MGFTDVPPEGTPAWVVPASTLLLAGGVAGWLIAYALMVRRSLASNATPVPLLPLGLNLGWELAYAFYITESWLELAGFSLWLVLDVFVLYATMKTARHSFADSPMVARNVGPILASVVVYTWACNVYFAKWWMEEPHRGYGVKWGKTWFGQQARDATELAFWSAGFVQMAFSVGALAMLLQRGHSRGQSHAIWFFRFVGTLMGLPGSSLLLWWYWPEAHGYIWQPLSFIFIGTGIACDVAYPFVLAHVRRTEQRQKKKA